MLKVNEHENEWVDEMIKLKVDGIVFYPISQNPYDKNCTIHCEYTTEEFKTVKGYPKSNWAYYKVVDEIRQYLNADGSYIDSPNINQSISQQLKVNMKVEAVRAELSCLNCVLDHDVNFDNEDIGDIRFLELGTVVLNNCKCDGCGCNSFNAKLFYSVTID